MLPINKTISMIERCNLLYRNHVFKTYNLRGYQASFLIEIRKNQGLSQEQLTATMHIDKSNVARGVEHLRQLGYVNKVTDETDRRVTRLFLTDEGERLVDDIKRILKEQRKELMKDFDEEEERLLLSLLKKLQLRAEILCEEVGKEQ